jgi:hypothetical protein
MNYRQKPLSACLIALAALFSTAPIQGVWAQTAPSLGTASTFGALGGTGVTCTSPIPPLPATTVTGNVGAPGPAPTLVTGFPGYTPGALPCSLSGTVQLNLGYTAGTPYGDFLAAYNAIDTTNPCPPDAAHNLHGDLGGMTLSPGVYCISGAAAGPALLTSQLTLAGPSAGVWIFKALQGITPIGGSVVMAGSGNACNVYWLTTVVSLNATRFLGNVLSGSAITFTGVGSSLAGRALAQTDVTMTGASITSCGSAGSSGNGGDDDGDDNDNGHDGNDNDNGHGNGHDGHDNDNGHGSKDGHGGGKDHKG